MTPDAKKLLNAIDPVFCLDFLSQLVRFQSTSGSPGEAALARFLAERMAGLGMETRLQHVEADRHNAIGVWRGAGRSGGTTGPGGGRSILLNGHMDTNLVSSGWTVDPFAGLVDEEFIYGIGVSNTKAGDAAFFCAVKTLIEQEVRLRGDVTLEYVVGELQGGVGTLKAIDEGVRADCFIVCEPTDLAALTMHCGAFNFVIELTGATRHVSKRQEAVDAIAAACALVPRINRATFRGAANEEHRFLNRANVGVLRGSLTPQFHDERPPQVADFARLVGTARYAPSQGEEMVLADLQGMLAQLEGEFPGLKARVSVEPRPAGVPPMLPFEVNRQAPVVHTVNRAYEAVRGVPQPTGAVPPACFFVTDAAHLCRRARMEGLVCGPGGKYNTMPDERVDIADYLDAIRIYLLTILDVCA